MELLQIIMMIIIVGVDCDSDGVNNGVDEDEMEEDVYDDMMIFVKH